MRKMRTKKQRRERWKKNLHSFAEKMRNEPTRCERKLWRALGEIAAHEGWALQSQAVITPFIIDILIANKNVAIEVDGAAHARRKERDENRDKYLLQKGFRTIRITNRDIYKDIAACIERIKQFV